uniref:Uncharacterized protein n=1 Tax=Heterorhabditis bacteriophora TaxID=37862 RepID=A0A1I7W895_HETBA
MIGQKRAIIVHRRRLKTEKYSHLSPSPNYFYRFPSVKMSATREYDNINLGFTFYIFYTHKHLSECKTSENEIRDHPLLELSIYYKGQMITAIKNNIIESTTRYVSTNRHETICSWYSSDFKWRCQVKKSHVMTF